MRLYGGGGGQVLQSKTRVGRRKPEGKYFHNRAALRAVIVGWAGGGGGGRGNKGPPVWAGNHVESSLRLQDLDSGNSVFGVR